MKDETNECANYNGFADYRPIEARAEHSDCHADQAPERSGAPHGVRSIPVS